MLTEYLSSCGFLVHTAMDGLDAIIVALREPPSIILMDLMTPRMDRCEATRHLKAYARTIAIPIMAFSSYRQVNGRQPAEGAERGEPFRKSCDLDQLADEIRKRVESCSESVGSRSIKMDLLSLENAVASDIALDDAIAAAIERHTPRTD